jgi:hypothetical protein
MEVLEVLASEQRGFTCAEVAEAMGLSARAARGRLSGLIEKEQVVSRKEKRGPVSAVMYYLPSVAPEDGEPAPKKAKANKAAPKKAKAKAAPKKAKAKAAPKKAKAKAAPKKAKAKAALKKVKETVKKAAPKKKAEPVEAKISGKVFTFARRPQGWLPKTCPKCEKVVAKTLVQLTKLFGWRTPSGGHTIPQPQCRACRAVASRAAAAKKRRASIEESKKAAPKKKKAPAAGRGKKKKKAAGKAEKK